MASLKQIKKNVTQNSLIFPKEMYTSLPGSIVITSYILNNERPDIKDIKKKWKYYCRHGLPTGLEKETYIQDVLKCFDCSDIPYQYAAFVQFAQGNYNNCLVAPYVEGQLLPLREDGVLSLTLRKGKIYPLSKEGIQNGIQTDKTTVEPEN